MATAGLLLAIALASAALMGAAIQRGATCMVAAVDEAVRERRLDRSRALLEAALWVGGLVAVAQAAGMVPAIARHATGLPTVLGGVLLGLGAWINRACVFGAVARIGSGQLAWLGTPVGFFLGSLAPLQAGAAQAVPAPFAWPAVIGLAFGVLLLARAAQALRAPALGPHLWHPHRATLLIALTYFATLLAVGPWAYTDALADLARPMGAMDARIALRGTMVVALLAGAIAGGWLAGKLTWQRVTVPALARCVAGGALMGAGALLVPGSNDGLIMLGLPLLLPQAWVAVATMTATLAVSVAISEALARAGSGSGAEMDRPAGR
jgi:uncharacterized membrane protein YedE/YeeE